MSEIDQETKPRVWLMEQEKFRKEEEEQIAEEKSRSAESEEEQTNPDPATESTE